MEPRNTFANAVKRPAIATILFVALTTGSLFTPARSQEPTLIQRQQSIAERYHRLEELLLRLADVEAAENPERAALLRQASKQSREKFVLNRLRNAAESLKNQKYSDAISSQDVAKKGLAELLILLTSEDRANRIRDEKEHIQKVIKNLKRIERSQRSTRARTENGADLGQLQREQESLGDRSENLKEELAEDSDDGDDENVEDRQPSSDGEPSEPEEPGQEGEESESEPKAGDSDQKGSNESNETESNEQAEQSGSKESDPKSGEQSKSNPSDSQQAQNQSQSGEQSQQSPPQNTPQTPQEQAEQQLQEAIKRMRQAEQDLEESKRDEAVEEQQAAEENLRKAIDQLEQILRQLREEEMQRELARLESRLKKMAAMQTKLLDDTIALSATPKEQRNRQTDLKAGDLSFEEKKITVEADRAMLLLREEGSSVAFPEVIDQIKNDTAEIAKRLGKTQIDLVTQGMQEDVIAAIEEMVQALQQAQRDLEKQKQQGQQQQQQQAGQPGEQPLVGAISELKLIRTMESRIKTTTERYSQLLQTDETTAQDLLPLMKNLSDRQTKLYKITRDLVMKRNQ